MNKREILADSLTDVFIELKSQVAKTALLISAVALSIGVLVSSLGITSNAAHAIDADLAASTARQVNVQFTEPVALEFTKKDADKPLQNGLPPLSEHYPRDAVCRIHSLDTVQFAGINLEVSSQRAVSVEREIIGYSRDTVRVRAVSSEYFAAAELKYSGPTGLLDSELSVAFLGKALAKNLGIPITTDLTGFRLKINGENFSIAGFVSSEGSSGQELFIPYQVGVRMVGSDAMASVLVRSELGAGPGIAHTVRFALLPSAPESLSVSQVVSAEKTRSSVSLQMTRQTIWIGLFLIVLTVLLIANSMVVAVTSRMTEIGVRRALGASRGSVAMVFLLEGAVVGFLGGLGGSALSTVVIVGISWISGWSAFLNPLLIAAGPVTGTLVGLLASAYPAWRASRIQPALAVRST